MVIEADSAGRSSRCVAFEALWKLIADIDTFTFRLAIAAGVDVILGLLATTL